MKQTLILLFLFFAYTLGAQIKGTVTDTNNQPLPYVNIYLENSYTGTTSNEEGIYSLEISERGTYTLIFQYLGFETIKKEITVDSFPFTLHVTLKEATVSLDEVIINTTEDPAYRIIRETIAKRKENLEKISAYTANFYSRGLWRVDSIPKKILGQEVGDFGGALDSTRTGIIYLSETISHIAYRKPNDFKETIIASKLSGNDNGFSFNSAQDANFSFYENTVDLNAQIVSPIASNALSYYKYKLEGVFYEGSKLVNKIKVTPKRANDRIWEGTMYIVEDDWQLYGLDLKTTGTAIQVPFVKELIFKQNFKFDGTENAWIKISQTIDFSFGFLGFNGDGRFIAVYSDYNFKPDFNKKTFGNEVLYFDPEANKKDSLFWEEKRPVRLTEEETKDYVKKDSIQELRKSKSYLDSIDTKNNTLSLLSPFTGYSYKNTYNKWELSYQAPLPGINFNTVQGWNGNAGLSFFKWYDENRTQWLQVSLSANYGVSEDRLRWKGNIAKKFNSTNRLQLSVFGGSEVKQFNGNNPISPFINSISTLFFERNYMKVFELNYAGLGWFQEITNGVRTNLSVSYQSRVPLFNNTTQVVFPQENIQYSSNNPLAPNDYNNPTFSEHRLVKTNFEANISFAQKYMTYPDGKFNYGDSKYPILTIGVENALAASEPEYNFTQLKARIHQELKLGNLGELHYNIKGGTFFNAEDISFVDFQHFNGNQTRIGSSSNYTNVFNLLPYYTLSTNKSYFETHAEHNFKGWVLNKIPGINQLGFNLVLGGHYLSTQDQLPYTEISLGLDNIGWGKYRLLRLDYVQSYFQGNSQGAFIFGLTFLNLLN
ncbi:MAG: carboxypeptidase-like regulatory domain-containing protein [Flavobacteriaceae bacterium]|nr:carboxypeptidase-like regulatory domain-containing protein [Flavobacteriaceae bacterium]